MRRYLLIFLRYFSPLLAFFVLETITHGNQLVPLVLVILYTFYLYKSSRYKKSETILFITAGLVGLIIEIGLTSFSREQFWQNTYILSVPLWLPFAWAVAGVVFYRFGKEFESTI